MTGPEHYREAEQLLEEFGAEVEVSVDALPILMAQLQAGMARAQVHATLALAAATALVAGDDGRTGLSDYDAWSAAASTAAASRRVTS